MMQDGKPEEYIVMRIRRVGAIHYQHGIPFPSAVWREFKSSTLNIISECEFKSHDVSFLESTPKSSRALGK
ncbi:hypothetical protein ANCCAN_30149 [Ancylostoma caninum]|uniref:Uncharacterized protein n=1 Tax=Ancylostoma caninum TaxID=29170 RepID=A0A368EWP8_ANCCA|nr:hypothetical protein ANCCAN_30149 [Ancylostoma caninum]